MICVGVQPARIDKLEPTDPPDYNKPRSSSPSRSHGLGPRQMAEVSTMVSNLPQPLGAYPDVYGSYSTHQFSQPWQSRSALQPYDEEFLGSAIGQKRYRAEDEFASGSFSSRYQLGSGGAGGESSTYAGPSVKVSRDMSSRSVDAAAASRGGYDVSWAPLGEIVKKAMERSSPRAATYSSSPSYTQEYSSDSGKHSDVSKQMFSPPPHEGSATPKLLAAHKFCDQLSIISCSLFL